MSGTLLETGRAPAVTRVVGIDVARGLALLGMMATHILPGIRDGEVTTIQQVAGGRSSALFAVLAGVSLVLLAGTRRPLRGRMWLDMQVAILVRALLIGAVGLYLGSLETNIAVILVYYAVFFVLAAPLLALTTRWLVAVAAVSLVLGPPLSFALRSGLPPPTYAVPEPASLGDPTALLRELLLTGYYPAATWLPYLVVGMVVGRLDLRSTAVALRVAATGVAAVVVSWWAAATYLARPGVRGALVASFEGPGWAGDLDTTLAEGLYGVTPTGSWSWLLVQAPHTGSWLDLLGTIGSALAVLGLCVALGLELHRLPGRLGTTASRTLGVVFGAGAMTLTLYSLHVFLRQQGWWDGTARGDYLGQVALVLVVGALVRLAGTRGPLEAVVGRLATAARRVAGGRR